VTELSHDELATKLLASRKILIVPGYGLAVARCQAKLAEVVDVIRGLGEEEKNRMSLSFD
jgi:NAD(P) transhydrogenase